MIFVSVGTQKFQFNRLLRKIDDLIGQNIIKDTVYAQIGYSTYKPKFFAYDEFIDEKNFISHISASNLVITHSGVGCILNCVKNSKPVIVVPRMKCYGEHIDDHQYEIAKAFSDKGIVALCSDLDRLSEVINSIDNRHFSKYESGNKVIINIIKDYIQKENLE